MTAGLAYWILMLVWLVFSAWAAWPAGPGGWKSGGPSLLLFILLVLLGWRTFGPPITGL